MNLQNINVNAGSGLIDNLRSFLHLTTQAPLELVCKSALYLLRHVPATRPAVFEYIGTFYKVTTYLHVRYIFQQKNQPNRDLTAEMNNINHINQVLDLIEASISEMLQPNSSNELWSNELLQWLIDLIGDIVSSNGVAFAETPNFSLEESNQFKNLSLVDAIELWSIQCKPTRSILNLIRKSFLSVKETALMAMFEMIFVASSKYSSQFDWILCDLSAQNPELIFENCLKHGFKDFMTSAKLNRINVYNFYASNFAAIVKNELVLFLEIARNESLRIKKSTLIYLLSLSSSCTPLASLILNEMLSEDNDYGCRITEYMNECLVDVDTSLVKYFIDCIKQLGNSVAVFDLLCSSIDWLSLMRKSEPKNDFMLKLIVN